MHSLFFAYGLSVASAPFVEMTTLFQLHCLYTFVKNQLIWDLAYFLIEILNSVNDDLKTALAVLHNFWYFIIIYIQFQIYLNFALTFKLLKTMLFILVYLGIFLFNNVNFSVGGMFYKCQDIKLVNTIVQDFWILT